MGGLHRFDGAREHQTETLGIFRAGASALAMFGI
jgi:hypothetical protein